MVVNYTHSDGKSNLLSKWQRIYHRRANLKDADKSDCFSIMMIYLNAKRNRDVEVNIWKQDLAEASDYIKRWSTTT